MKNFYFALFSIAILAGCAPAHLQLDNPDKKMAQASFIETHRHYVWGLWGSSSIQADKACPKTGLNSIETTRNTLNGFIDFMTGGIYIPTTYAVYCNK